MATLLAAFLVCHWVSGPVGAREESPPASDPSVDLRFVGNQALDEGALRESAAIELTDFREDGTPADADDAAFQMETAYRQSGYPFAEVRYEIDRREDRVQLTFRVEEGPRVLLESVQIEGNTAFPADSLRAFFETRRGLLGGGERVYVESAVESAASDIHDLYYRSGYTDVRLVGPEVSFNEERTRATVTLQIEEGPRYTTSEVQYRGDVLPAAEPSLADLEEEMTGQAYFRRRKVDLRGSILDIYGNLGYPETEVEIEERSDPESGAVVLVAEIRSGPQVTIEEIRIAGNESTQGSFIRQRLDIREGEVYDQDRLNSSFRSLFRTGLFETVDFSLQETSSPERRILQVEVTEAPSQEVWLEPGWGSYERARLSIGYREKNLLGTGRMARTEGTVSAKSRRATVGFTDPWFLGSEVTLDVPLTYRWREEPSFVREELGIEANFSRSLLANIIGTAGYVYRATALLEVKVDGEETDLDESYTLGAVNSQLTYDNRDDIFFPTAGRRHHISAEYAAQALGGSIGFYRFGAGTRHYFGWGTETVLALRYATGLVIPGPNDVNVPLGERYFNGGENSVRSFQQAELGPKDTNGDPVGGLAYNVVNLELRRILVGNFAATVFFDYGNVSPNRSRVERGEEPYTDRNEIIADTLAEYFQDFRPGVGFGLLYLLPVGPARLDFAFNPGARPSDGEDRYVWHFSVGTAF